MVFLGSAPGSGAGQVWGRAPFQAESPKGPKGEGWVPWGDSIPEAPPVVRRFLNPCSGRFPNILSETLGASGALQVHPARSHWHGNPGNGPRGTKPIHRLSAVIVL